MFEKEAKERAKRKIYNFIVSDLGVSQIITGQTCETVEGMPHFYQYSLEKMWQEGAEYGYNKCKEELNHKGLALQSDMDKTIEQNIAHKKENAELQEKISVLLSCKKCPENKGGWICVKEYEDKCLAQKIELIKELKKENAEMKEQLTKAMKKKVIYISGKITSTSDYADRFSAAEDKLIAEGYEVMNPVREGKWLEHYLEPEKPTWVQYMKYDIATMMKADHIYMMRGWKQSKGARVEHFLARALSYTIIYEEE